MEGGLTQRRKGRRGTRRGLARRAATEAFWTAAGSAAPRRFGSPVRNRKAVSPQRSATAVQKLRGVRRSRRIAVREVVSPWFPLRPSASFASPRFIPARRRKGASTSQPKRAVAQAFQPAVSPTFQSAGRGNGPNLRSLPHAGWKTGETADWKVCATDVAEPSSMQPCRRRAAPPRLRTWSASTASPCSAAWLRRLISLPPVRCRSGSIRTSSWPTAAVDA